MRMEVELALRPARRARLASRRPPLPVAIVVAFLGCSDASDPAPACGTFGAGTGPELAVGTGITPAITWAPNCVATGIFVVRTDEASAPAEVVWNVRTRAGEAGFDSRQVFGTTPPRTEALVAPKALVPGGTYVASISIDGVTAAVRDFTVAAQ